MGTAFSVINAVQISSLQKQNAKTSDELATLTHISGIQEDHLDHLEIEYMTQDAIMLNALRYNPAILQQQPIKWLCKHLISITK